MKKTGFSPFGPKIKQIAGHWFNSCYCKLIQDDSGRELCCQKWGWSKGGHLASHEMIGRT